MKTKNIIKKGLTKLFNNSHILNNNELSIDDFLNKINIDLLENKIGKLKTILGYGVFGVVFKNSMNKAIKFSFDYKEASFLKKYCIDNKTKGFVEIDDIIKIKYDYTKSDDDKYSYMYIIIRDEIEPINNRALLRSVFNDLKYNNIDEYMFDKYNKIGGLELEVFNSLITMYNIDPNWRGTHIDNIAKQNGRVVLYDGFSKNIYTEENIDFLNLSINETMINKNSLEQLKRIDKLMRKTKSKNKKEGNRNIKNYDIKNDIYDMNIQTYEDFLRNNRNTKKEKLTNEMFTTKNVKILENIFPEVDNLKPIRNGLFEREYIGNIGNDLVIVKLTNSFTEYMLSNMVLVSNPPNIVNFRKVEVCDSDSDLYAIIHDYVTTDALPDKETFNLAITHNDNGIDDSFIKDVLTTNEQFYEFNLIKEKINDIESFLNCKIDAEYSNWGYNDKDELVIFNLDGNIIKSKYKKFMEKYNI